AIPIAQFNPLRSHLPRILRSVPVGRGGRVGMLRKITFKDEFADTIVKAVGMLEFENEPSNALVFAGNPGGGRDARQRAGSTAAQSRPGRRIVWAVHDPAQWRISHLPARRLERLAGTAVRRIFQSL